MKLIDTMEEARKLNAIIENSVGNVWLENSKGVRYDLKNRMTRTILFKEILNNEDADEYKIFAAVYEDISSLTHFYGEKFAA